MSEPEISLAQKFSKLPKEEYDKIIEAMTPAQLNALNYDWNWWARPKQLRAFKEEDWTTFLLMCGRGWGKLNPLDTTVNTTEGWKTIGTLEVGDYVFDEQGNPTKVLQLHPIETPEKAYRLWFNDGSYVDAGPEHNWATWTAKDRKQYLRNNEEKIIPLKWVYHRPEMVANCTFSRSTYAKVVYEKLQGKSINKIAKETGLNNATVTSIVRGKFEKYLAPYGTLKTTQEVVDTLTYSKRGDTNHCIPNTPPINYPKKEVPIPAYLFGAWVGDRDSSGGGFTQDFKNGDKDHLIAAIIGAGFEYRARKDEKSVGTIGLTKKLKSLGVTNNKHIPEIYLRNCEEYRLELLQGLMDTDGHVYIKGTACEFSQSNEIIAKQVYELIVSLGMKATISSRIPVNTVTGLKGKRNWRIFFCPTMQVFKLPRKAARLKFDGNQTSKRFHRMIVKAEEIPPVPMRCITVDSISSLFLISDHMIPTGNSRTGTEWVRHIAETKPGSYIAVVGPTTQSVNRTLVEGPTGLLNICPPGSVHYQRTKAQVKWKNGSVALLYALDVDTDIPTPTGFTKMLDLEVGDKVFDEKGQPTTVIKTSPVYLKNTCYELTLKSGAKIVADAGHKWNVFDSKRIKNFETYRRKNSLSNNLIDDWATWHPLDKLPQTVYNKIVDYLLNHKTQKDIVLRCNVSKSLVEKISNELKNGKPRDFKTSESYVFSTEQLEQKLQHKETICIPIVRGSVAYTDCSSLSLDPWILGYLLGDGDSSGGGRVACDAQDLQFLREKFESRGMYVSATKDDGHFYVKNLKKVWKHLELVNNKHIPDLYKFSSKEDRINLIKGLIDSDGSVGNHRNCVFDNTNKKLIEDTEEVCRSLGYKTKIYTREGRYRKGVASKTSYSLHIHSKDIIASLPRKVNKIRTAWNFEQEVDYVVSIKKVASRPVKCITVGAESHLFLATKKFIITGNSAERPDRLRGPNHHYALADEIVAWKNPETWDMLKFTLRIGTNPRTFVTTTPKPTDLILKIIGGEDNVGLVNSQDYIKFKKTVVVRGTTFENTALAQSALDDYLDLYENTAMGEQELYAKLLINIQGALFKKEWFRHYGLYADFLDTDEVRTEPVYTRTVVAVDPATTSTSKSDQTAICVVSKGEDGRYYVRHCEGHQKTPDGWAQEVVKVYNRYNADKIVCEVNNGGDMVESTIRHVKSYSSGKRTFSVDAYAIPIEKIHAKKGKLLRAEEVALLYEQGRVTHMHSFSDLESQMLVFKGEPNGADDLVDAMVYGVKELAGVRMTESIQPQVIGGGLVSDRILLL